MNIATIRSWVKGFAARFARARDGGVAMLFGLSLPIVVMAAVAGVDIHRASTVRVNLQDALDAAALAAARSQYVDAVNIQRIGLATLEANLQAYPEITLRRDQTTFILNSDEVIVASSKVDVQALIANIILPPYGKLLDDTMPVGARSEVNRSSKNVEVALVLDVTGSMSGQKILDLKAAAKELVDIVVQPVQTPFYSRMALVPYSMGVNLGGSLPNTARGTPVGYKDITNATWTNGTSVNITGVTKANPAVVTAPGHGLQDGDSVWISGVGGMTQLNKKVYQVRNAGTNTFQLRRNGSTISSTGYNSYTSGGTVQECQFANCQIVITAPGHGLSNADHVWISHVSGMTAINDDVYAVGNVTADSYTIDLNASSSINPYTGGGRSWCAQEGCTYFAFENVNDDLRTHRISGCVSERIGDQAYTDAYTSGASSWVGRVYLADPTDCLGSTVTPLSSSIASLKSSIDTYQPEGSTAGQIGIAWGWYSLSPSFNALWSAGHNPAPYNVAETLKAVIIMTDGEFNMPYCKGVAARDAGNGGSGRINCDATNGDPFGQSERLCDGMKAEGVVVYTVGFQLAAGGDAEAVLRDCASTAANFFLPQDGGDLSNAFAAIGRDIMQLRISK